MSWMVELQPLEDDTPLERRDAATRDAAIALGIELMKVSPKTKCLIKLQEGCEVPIIVQIAPIKGRYDKWR